MMLFSVRRRLRGARWTLNFARWLVCFSKKSKMRRKKKTEVTRTCNKDGLDLLEILDHRKVYQNEDHPT